MPVPDDPASVVGRAGANAADADDPRLAFVYQEALRGLLQQQAAVESLHNRAATLVFAASFASSLLGGRSRTASASGIGQASSCCWPSACSPSCCCGRTTTSHFASIPRNCSRTTSTELLHRRCPRCIG